MSSKPATQKGGPKYTRRCAPDAGREWEALNGPITQLLKSLLAKRLQNPHVPGALLHRELAGCYKIKLLKHGYRLVYSVEDDVLVVLVLSVGKREDSEAYMTAAKRMK